MEVYAHDVEVSELDYEIPLKVNKSGIFTVPKLDYTRDPSIQNILHPDIHGKIWKFIHIYKGTPQNHLLTTGWYVKHKKLIVGDSIVFLRADNGDFLLGFIRVVPESITKAVNRTSNVNSCYLEGLLSLNTYQE